jgi:hypothetical protein
MEQEKWQHFLLTSHVLVVIGKSNGASYVERNVFIFTVNARLSYKTAHDVYIYMSMCDWK